MEGMSGIMCDKRNPIELKVKVYKTVVRLYGSVLWALWKAEQQLIERTDMIVVWRMFEVSRAERKGNVEARKRAEWRM